MPCVAVLALAAATAPTPALGASVTHVPGSAGLLFLADAGEANRVTVTSTGATLTVTDPGAGALRTDGDCGPLGPGAVSCPAAEITALDVSGGDGDDEIVNATGVGGQLQGNDGDDVVRGGTAPERLEGGAGADVLAGGGGDDGLYGATSQAPDAGSDADRLAGGSGNDRLFGGGGSDSLDGGTGNDQVNGNSGEDYVDGRRGVDRLDGGAGPDVVVARDGARDEPVSCGSGQDLAIVDRRDRVARSGGSRCERVDDGSETRPRPGWVYVQPQPCAASHGGAELGLPAMHRLVPLRYSILLRTGYRGRPAPWFDSSECNLRLTATPGQGRRASATVSGGAAQLEQTAGRTVSTALSVVPPACAVASSARAARPRPTRLRVSTDRRRGRWRVRGRFSVAASFGTDWTTLDGCLQTTTTVRRGRVRVHDDVKRRTVTVRAGHRYVARAR